MFAGPILPPMFDDWMQTTGSQFNRFYETYAWRDVEDPQLMRRVAEFKEACHDR